ncbi:MAG TPA: SDR family oxidoreductase [Burkholderiaceae bacterium]|nr:SDR family oxidoreductase [Burkholderiaceae bacterium]
MTSFDDTHVPDYFARMRLDGKGMVILGAGRGIGRQIAHALAQAGARLLCVDRDSPSAQKISEEVGGIPFSADVTSRANMQKVFDFAARELERPHGIVDVVGRVHLAPIEAIDDDAYNRQAEIVFRHAWLAIQFGAPWLAAAGGGAITFVGSLSGITAAPNQSLYGAQKAALHHLARCAAVEYGPKGVRVNTVAPGPTRTPRFIELMEPILPEIESTIPLRRSAAPADVASVVLFLSGDLARHVTAQTIAIDGGATSTILRAASQTRVGQPG